MEGLERAKGIIRHQIMKRESKRDDPKYLLQRNLLSLEIKSLEKSLLILVNS